MGIIHVSFTQIRDYVNFPLQTVSRPCSYEFKIKFRAIIALEVATHSNFIAIVSSLPSGRLHAKVNKIFISKFKLTKLRLDRDNCATVY